MLSYGESAVLKDEKQQSFKYVLQRILVRYWRLVGELVGNGECIKARRGNTSGSLDHVSKGAPIGRKDRNKRSSFNLEVSDSQKDILILRTLFQIACFANITKKGDQTMPAIFYSKIAI